MKISFILVAALAVVASPNCRASVCAIPERDAALADLSSVAAPEMLAATGTYQGCLSAQQMVELIRVDVPTEASGPTVVDSNGYVPKTKDDNTPWRFDMHQNGKRMTADQFDAWMKAKGIHVATGKPASASVPVAPPAAAPTATTCLPGETAAC